MRASDEYEEKNYIHIFLNLLTNENPVNNGFYPKNNHTSFYIFVLTAQLMCC